MAEHVAIQLCIATEFPLRKHVQKHIIEQQYYILTQISYSIVTLHVIFPDRCYRVVSFVVRFDLFCF